eukprot:COSAG04_NODE_2031_length_4967_cov_44.282251_1_plen_1200_part_00
MHSLARALASAAVLSTSAAQCGPDDIEHVHEVCCPTANACAQELPQTCSGACSSTFLDFNDQCSDLINQNPQTAASFQQFANQCRQSFGACNSNNDCGSNAVCLNMLGCTRPPCSRCLCQQGYEGDGHTCSVAPPPPPPPAPDILGSNTRPTAVNADGAETDGSIGRGGQVGFYSLNARAGTAYTITVELGDLDDSVLEIWKGPRNSPTLAAMNDDANGGLGSQVDWTPDSAGTYFIIVRGFSPSQRGSFTLTVATDSTPARPGGHGNSNGDPCNGGAVLHQASGAIDFSHSYNSNAQCTWEIVCRGRDRHPSIDLTDFDTEANFDFLTLYSGSDAHSQPIPDGRISGSMPATTHYTSEANSMFLTFTSDSSIAGNGFALRYTCGGNARPIRPAQQAVQAIRVGQTLQGNLAHPGDIQYYSFTAQAGTAYTISTELSTLPDSVVLIYDQDRTTELAQNDDGPEGPPGTPHNTASYLEWTAPRAGNFFIAVRGFDPSQRGMFTLTLAGAGGAGGGGDPCQGGTQISNGHGSISFTAAQYTNDAHCDWTITCPQPNSVASITFRRLDTEQHFDQVQMYDGPTPQSPLLGALSGNLPDEPAQRHIAAHGNTMLVEFTSDSSVGGNGFEAQYSCGRVAGPGQGPSQSSCDHVRVNSDRPQTGNVDNGHPIKFFCLDAQEGSVYDLTVTLGTLQDSVMDVCNAGDRQCGSNSDGAGSLAHNDDGQGTLASFIQFTAPTTGTYYIAVRGFQPQLEGSFTLDVTQETDGHGNGDAGHSDSPCLREDGTGGSTLARRSGVIAFTSEMCQDGCQCDWRIQCHDDQVATVHFPRFQTEAHWDNVQLYDGGSTDARAIAPGSGLSGGQGSGAPGPQQRFTATQATMLIEFTSDQSEHATNAFNAEFTCAAPADRPPAPPAQRITLGTATSGNVRNGPVRYSFQASGGSTYQMEVVLDSLPDSVLDLYDKDGSTQLAENDDYGASLASYIEWTAPSDGTYFVAVRGFSPNEQGTFSLTVTEGGSGPGGGGDPSSGGGDPCQGDGATLGGNTGTLSYMPAGQYSNNADCSWHFSCSESGTVPTFTLTQMDTEGGWDWVDLFDGAHPDTSSDEPVGHLSGGLADLTQLSYQARSSAMTIHFTSDNSVGGAGFEGTYSCAAPAGHGGDCMDHIEELSGVGACEQYMAQGYTCDLRFCPTCSFAHMCDKTCGICH